MEKTIVIIGGVAGGASCAARLRRQDENVKIIILEKGPFVSFANCGLPYYIGNTIKKEEDLLIADTVLFKERFNVDARVLNEVINIDTDKNSISVKSLSDNSEYELAYDELVLSPGASPIKPPFPGVDLPGIFTIRSVPDSNHVKSWIATRHVDRAVVIGGGFIGLEMAENLAHLDIKVSLIERADQVMPVLDKAMTIPVVEEMEKNGISLVLGESVSAFKANADRITVVTDSGRKLHTDMVIMAIGVSPDSSLASDAGIEVTERGHIVVDEHMRTSTENVYAVGDVIQVHHVVSGQKTVLPLAGPANRQGRIVADVISGRERTFRGVQGTSVCGLFNITMAATGMTESQLRDTDIDYCAIYAHPNNHVGYYPGATPINMKMLFDRKDGRVLGAQAVGQNGAERRIDVIAMGMQMNATVFDFEECELCYAPQYGAAKDPVNILGMIGSNVMRGELKVTKWEDIGKDGVLILDVRGYNEIANSPIANQPSILHIPLNELRSRLDELPKDQPIQVSCAVGARANNAARILTNNGYDASILPGGTFTLGYIEHCIDSGTGSSALIQKGDDALEILHAADSAFSVLPLALLQDLKRDGIIREYVLSPGESISLKASSASDILLLGAGEVDVMELGQMATHLSSGEKYRSPVRLGSNVSKTFYSETTSTLFRIDQEVLDFYDSWYVMLDYLFSEREDLKAKLTDFRPPAVFMNIPLSNIQESLKLMETVIIDAGQDIVTEGEVGDKFYILIDGEAEVWAQGLYDSEQRHLRTLGAGTAFGEDALIMEGNRTASVKALGRCELLSLKAEDFRELISSPQVREVDHGTAKIQLEQGQRELLDVRYEEEWDEDRIPNATLIPLPDLRTRINELDSNKAFIVYCHAGKRSAVAAMILRQNGFDAIWLTNGIRDWPYEIESEM